jgi:hypothetical protein
LGTSISVVFEVTDFFPLTFLTTFFAGGRWVSFETDRFFSMRSLTLDVSGTLAVDDLSKGLEKAETVLLRVTC